MDRIVLTLPIDIAYVRVAALLSRTLCEPLVAAEQFSEFAGSVELAVSEACTNAVKFTGNAKGPQVYEVAFLIGSDRLCIEVTDHGPGFDLNAVPLPDFDLHPQGGYGIYLILDRMSEVSYDRKALGNTLRMTKLLPKKEPDS